MSQNLKTDDRLHYPGCLAAKEPNHPCHPMCKTVNVRTKQDELGLIAQRKKDTLRDRVESDFTYHVLDHDAAMLLRVIAEKTKELALLMVRLTPEGRELSTALTKLEESLFHVDAAISRQYPLDR